MKDERNQKKASLTEASVKLAVSALLKESGDVAPIDFGRFGKRVGEIIARASAHPFAKPQ